MIIHGDCLEVMKNFDNEFVDLIVADSPYNIGKDVWDKWKKESDYIDWCLLWIKECERVLKNNGSFYFFHNDMRVISKLMERIEKETKFVFKQLITWCKLDPSFDNYGFSQQRLSNGTSRNYYGGFTEYCLFYTFQDETGLKLIYENRDCFKSIKDYMRGERKKISESKGFKTQEEFNQYINEVSNTSSVVSRHYFPDSQWVFPTEEIYKLLQTTGFFKQEYENLRQEYENLRYTFNVGRVLDDFRGNSNVWLYAPAEQIGHCTPKPLHMIENIIKHSSNEGDLVLDPFLGSGTTAVACKKLNRDFIGIEKEKKYVDLAYRRLNELK